MNILIVDDDVLQSEALKKIILEYNSSWTIFCANNTTTATSLFTDNPIDIFFLDIEFPEEKDTDGLILAKTIRNSPDYQSSPILFTTAYENKVFEAISNIHCFDFIVKPYDKGAICKTLDSLTSTNAISKNEITIKDMSGVFIVVNYRNIIYVESYNHGVLLHTVLGDYHYVRHYINEMVTTLDNSFLQIHKKYIINKNFITSYDKTNQYLHVKNAALPVGRVYKPSLDNYFNEKLQKK